MKGKILTHFILLFLVMLILSLSNCGGSSDNGAIPDIASPQQTGQNLVNKDISGYVYHISSFSSSETEDEEENFSILEVPITGEEGFIAQVNEYFQTEPSSRTNSPETDELLNVFTEEASCFVPLNSWNSGANLFSVYSDSENSSSIPVGAEGEISASVPVDAGDDLVSLEIGSPEGEYYEAETISTSDLVSSDESGINLKSCPKQILIKPGKCEIFKVFSKPSANLYDAGLHFSLANPEYGCLAGPIFIKCKGFKQTGVAYGILYVKKNLNTPLDTAINVNTAVGQSLSIPVQIVKKTAVVSGTVYAGGPILKGHVVSQGPKSQCKINANGTYSLSKVWQGTGRKVTATWWVMEGNRKVRYRETKYVDIFGDVTVDFGVVPVPTLPPPTDEYYDQVVMKVLEQKWQWEEELGVEEGVQKTVDWLNGKVPEPPLPEEIIPGTIQAFINNSDTKQMRIYFYERLVCLLSGYQESFNLAEQPVLSREKILYNNTPVTRPVINNGETTKNAHMKILCPYMWQFAYSMKHPECTVYNLVDEKKEELQKAGYDIIRKAPWKFNFRPLKADEEDADIEIKTEIDSYTGGYKALLKIYKLKDDNIVRPEDFEDLQNYGIIYIATHGLEDGISACPFYENDEKLKTWAQNNNCLGWWDDWNSWNINEKSPYWEIEYPEFKLLKTDLPRYLPKILTTKNIKLGPTFFRNQDLSGSLIYLNACFSDKYYNTGGFFALGLPKIYLGNDRNTGCWWAENLAYYYFYYLIDEYIYPLYAIDPDIGHITPSPYPVPYPMTAGEAYKTLQTVKATPDTFYYDPVKYTCQDCELILTSHDCDPNKFYLPGPIELTITED